MHPNKYILDRYTLSHPFSNTNEIIKSDRNKRIKLLHTLRQSITAQKKHETIKLLELHINNKDEQHQECNLKVIVKSLPNNYFFKLLVIPEFLLGINNTIAEESKLISNSLFFLRPSGKRMIVKINNFVAKAFDKGGVLRYTFDTKLCKGPSLLDAVVQNNQFYVCDVLLYNGAFMASSPTDCRLFFIKSRLHESTDSTFQCVNYYQTTPSDLKQIYELAKNSPDVEFDSLVFVAKDAEYLGGYNPYWLVWRDNYISNYDEVGTPSRVFIDTKTGDLSTLDGVHIGTLDVTGIKHKKRKMVVKINVSQVDLDNLQIIKYTIVTCKGTHLPLFACGPLPHSMRQILSRFKHDGRSSFYNLLCELENINVISID